VEHFGLWLFTQEIKVDFNLTEKLLGVNELSQESEISVEPLQTDSEKLAYVL